MERLSFDAWGKRRFPDGSDDPSGSITSQSTRGFTGEEELSVSGLVHLNGRVYDPLLARFTSADPTVTDPLNPQGWNRYSYVGNDPLAFTDPNGFSWLSSFFHSVTNFIRNNPIVRSIVQIASTVLLNAVLPGLGFVAGSLGLAAAAAAGGAAIATGLSGGNLGQILRAGAIAGVTAAAFFGVGDATNAIAGVDPSAAHIQPQFGTDAFALNVAGHALVGCASSAASGGSCQSGALSGAVTAGAGPLINGQNQVASLVTNAVLGGVASVAGGGKFANGAVTGAFGYLFNACGGPNGCAFLGGALGTGAGIIAAAGCDYASAGACVAANPGIVGVFGSGLAAIGAGLDIVFNGVPALPEEIIGDNPRPGRSRINTDLPASAFPGTVEDLTGGNVSPDPVTGHLCYENGVRFVPEMVVGLELISHRTGRNLARRFISQQELLGDGGVGYIPSRYSEPFSSG